MPHRRKKGKNWRKIANTDNLPDMVEVRCCCTPSKLLGFLPRAIASKFDIKWYGNDDSQHKAVYGDGKHPSFWKQQGLVSA